jgi:hypothetical protein
MAYSYVWEPTLPQVPQKGFSESIGALILRTPMDAGPAKQRYRGRRSDTMQLTFIMTNVQVATLETWITNTLRGTARFGFPHPRKSTVVEARIVPQGDGALFTAAYLAPGFCNVSLQFEILP